MTSADFTRTRRNLHGLAELLMAGPQFRRSGTIRLRVVPGGFATTKEPDIRVDDLRLLVDGRTLPLVGSYADLAHAAGIAPGAPANLYPEGSDVAIEDPVEIDPQSARRITDGLALGLQALTRFAPHETAVLWPEHFDLGVTWDEVNFGVSPGDAFADEPYAYVAPWTPPQLGAFWNAPFGAARPLGEFSDAATLEAFYTEGRLLAHEARSGR
ncbi:hypothetical protein ABIA33_001886 [Streptacidiphilus sp. MAP12-16]|uniref:hypothetical protein n=1 Tax=Streptacidiphilus sp. MAP12-16 TaxID=3156300 RepID=UPI003515D7DE